MYQIGLTCTVSLDVFLYWAMFVLDENHFRKCFFRNEAVWLVRKVLFSGNWNPLTEKKSLWPWKSFYTSIFLSKYFRKMRERERARAITISSPHRSRSRRQTFQSPLIAISPSRDRAVDRDLAFARSCRREIREEEFELCLSFSWVVACVFLDLCFPSSFPNTRKYFPENFLKCNQTHGNIFLFRKLAFPENMYFPENVLQQPNTA